MPKKIKVGNAVLCEHVVAGVFNKHTLINVYSGDIITARMPARLTFGFYFEVKALPGQSELEMEIATDDETLAIVHAKLPDDTGSASDGTIVVPMLTTTIPSDTHLSVTLKAEGYAKTRVMRKRIFLGEIPH